MAGGIAALGDSFPPSAGSAEQQIAALRGYITMLLENLRYLLANLDGSNFSEAGISEFGELIAAKINTKLLVSNSAITNELYSEYGDIAALTVDSLRTDYLRARRYVMQNTAPLDYIDAHDGEINFITATTDGSETEQLTRDGIAYWWRDAACSQMTQRRTPYPVICYKYNELVKMSLKFETIVLKNGTATVMPVVVLGAGTGTGTNGKAFIFKDSDGLVIRQVTSDGGYTDIMLTDFVDAKQRRLASCTVDTQTGKVRYTLEGSPEQHVLSFSETASGGIKYVWQDGFESEVSVV